MNQKEMELRNKFILNGIPYDELDKEMIPLLDVLNFKLGIKTKFCCYGHAPNQKGYIMFDDEVTDADISKIIVIDDYDIGNSIKIYKWARNVSYKRRDKYDFHVEPKMNWMMDIHPLLNFTEEKKMKRHRKIVSALSNIS